MWLLTLGCALITKDDYDWRTNLGGSDSGSDCEEPTTWFEDGDGDGFGDDASTVEACEQPEGYVEVGGDCADDTAGVWPGANEICNGASDDCDAEIDEDPIDGRAFAPDLDEDGYVVHEDVMFFCEGDQPELWIPPDAELESDCDDTEAAIHPGADEVCNGLDDDCDTSIDEEPLDGQTFWRDLDGDGYGDPEAPVVTCSADGELVDNQEDCDDTDSDVNPDEEEVQGDGLDNDCDGGASRLEGVIGSGSAYAQVYGEAFGDIGSAVVPVGDVDGDGAEDLLIGASSACDCSVDSGGAGATYPGAVWYLNGPVTGGHGQIEEMAAAKVQLDTDTHAYLGASLGGGPDLNGTGTASFFASAPVHGDEGVVYVFEMNKLSGEVEPSGAPTLSGEVANGYFGSSAVSGDLDSDGQPDLAVGARAANHNGAASGSVYVHLGPITGDADATDGAGHYKGRSGSQLGWETQVADMNGDGDDDLLLGAPYDNSAGVHAGAVYIAFGPTTSISTVSSLTALEGEVAGDAAGSAVSPGDVNGDGYDDVLVGAPEADVGVTMGGAAFLVLGPVTRDADLGDAEAIVDGIAASNLLGQDVEVVGDLDEDGYHDLAIGVPGGAGGAGVVGFFYGPVSGHFVIADGDFQVVGQSVGDNLHVIGPVADYLGEGPSFAVTSQSRTYDARPYAGMVYFLEHPEL